MAKDGGGTPHDLAVQSWIMYTIAIVLYLLRLYARYERMGLKWQPEDYVMVLVMGWYTAFVVTNIQLGEGAGGTLYTLEEYKTFTAEDIALREQGGKLEFASEQTMVNTIWTIKACMLIIYYRMTTNLRQQFWVKACAAFTIAGYIAVELTLFLNCRPFSGYWTIPPPHEQCATYLNYEIVQAVFNISSDLSILLVIIPTLWKMNMSNKEKLPLVFIFGMGFFLIICAIVSKIFTFKDIYDASYQFWYLREASIGVYVSNLPYVWSFLRRTIQFLHSSTGGSKKTSRQLYGGGKHPSDRPFTGRSRNNFSAISSNGDNNNGHHTPNFGRSESEEHIFTGASASANPRIETKVVLGGGEEVPLSELGSIRQPYNIHKTMEIRIHSDDAV